MLEELQRSAAQVEESASWTKHIGPLRRRGEMFKGKENFKGLETFVLFQKVKKNVKNLLRFH